MCINIVYSVSADTRLRRGYTATARGSESVRVSDRQGVDTEHIAQRQQKKERGDNRDNRENRNRDREEIKNNDIFKAQ